MDDIADFDPDLATNIQNNASRYLGLLYDVIDSLLPSYGMANMGMAGVSEESSPLDVIMAQRVQRNEGNEGGAMFPPALTRR